MNKDEYDDLRANPGFPTSMIRFSDLDSEDRARTLLVGYNTTSGTDRDGQSIHVYSVLTEGGRSGLIVVEWWTHTPDYAGAHLVDRDARDLWQATDLYPWKRVQPERSSASFIRLLRSRDGNPSLARFDETWESPGPYAYLPTWKAKDEVER